MRTRTALLAAVFAAALCAPASAATITVSPGDSIQKAVNRASSGDTVKVKPGTYKDTAKDCATCALSITKNDIKLVGAKDPTKVVLRAKSGQETGISVSKANPDDCLKRDGRRVKRSLIKGLTVKGFEENGLLLFCVDNWRITNVRATGNDEYGFFPLFSGKGRLDHSFASGASDTGLYVGQSHDVQMDHNVATKNVVGLELENTYRSAVHDNVAFGNTAGFISVVLPNLEVKFNRNNDIKDNDLHGNNKANTCGDNHDVVCNVPSGSGLVMVSTDRNLVTGNKVKNNKTAGIATVSYCILLGSEECHPDFEPNPDNNHITGNTVTGNGKDPAHPYEGIASDLIWDGTGKGNCWAINTYGTSFPDELPACGG
ncbi:MAG TPA: parallel beta-helix domain-containing protein [Thermoleophilaceae bacterium]|nr:parallel beta-helix domain-containing protein [Thermoleophilaceae bacterium]